VASFRPRYWRPNFHDIIWDCNKGMNFGMLYVKYKKKKTEKLRINFNCDVGSHFMVESMILYILKISLILVSEF
jgi:hypothetical protein